MNPPKKKGYDAGRILIVASIGAAVVFGLYFGIMLWANDSFPQQTEPFANYATITSTAFNGTVYSFTMKWTSNDTIPLYAQLSWTDSDQESSLVCDFGVSAPPTSPVVMPFGIDGVQATLTAIQLDIAVKTLSTGSEFTIVYNVNSVNATASGNLAQNYACTEPNSIM